MSNVQHVQHVPSSVVSLWGIWGQCRHQKQVQANFIFLHIGRRKTASLLFEAVGAAGATINVWL